MLRHKGDRAHCRVLVFLALGGVAASGTAEGCAPVATDHPLFVVSGPASAGKDLDVTCAGDPAGVRYRVGDGDWHSPEVGPDGRFTIPGKELEAGKDLVIDDRFQREVKPLLLPVTK